MHYQGIDGYVYNVLKNEKIASGGEGTIYAIQGNDKQVAKIFRDDKKTKDREEKLRLMVSKKMTDEQLEYFTWPQDVLYSIEGFVGYVMPKVTNMRMLTELYSEDKYDIEWRLAAAINVCIALEAIHETGQVCGDLNPLNILINLEENSAERCHVTLVDTDSYHVVTDTQDFRCEVGLGDYLAPEIQNKLTNGLTLRTAPLPTYTKATDEFALAVHIFALLMNGCHPFACAKQMGEQIQDDSSYGQMSTVQDSVVAPQPIENIKKGFFPFSQYKAGITIPISAPDFTTLPESLQKLFIRTFCDGYMNPTKRVSASEWIEALMPLWNEGFVECEAGHKHLRQSLICPICQVQEKIAHFFRGISNGKPPIDDPEHPPIEKKSGGQNRPPIASSSGVSGGGNGSGPVMPPDLQPYYDPEETKKSVNTIWKLFGATVAFLLLIVFLYMYVYTEAFNHYQQTLSGQTEMKNAPEICEGDLTQDIENGDLLVFYVESVEA